MSEIESEFKKTAKAINDKIKAAAMILEEAIARQDSRHWRSYGLRCRILRRR